jgi:hypothetical protein
VSNETLVKETLYSILRLKAIGASKGPMAPAYTKVQKMKAKTTESRYKIDQF